MAALVAAASALACAGSSAAYAGQLNTPWLHVSGTNIVDRAGRPVTLRGFNLRGGPVKKTPVHAGANFVRIFVDWGRVQPTRNGGFNLTYLKGLDREILFYKKHKVHVLIDIHQVHQSSYFPGGNGVPRWYYADGRYPPTIDGRDAARAAWWTTEADQSHAVFLPFVQMLVRRYRSYPNVLGYEMWNEPQSNTPGVPLHDQDQAVLAWLLPVRDLIRRLDPLRAVVFQTRGGADFGLGTADFSAYGPLTNMVLDFHNYYNGLHGSGYTPDGEDWFPDFEHSNNQFSTDYHGTIENQELHFATAIQRSQELGIPMIVGEWGARLDDVHRDVFNQQMLQLFAEHNLSWAEWAINTPTVFDFP